MNAPQATTVLPHFQPPYNWAAIDDAMQDGGGVILQAFLSTAQKDALNAQIDTYLADGAATGRPDSGSHSYDRFLGNRTIRLHGLLAKLPQTTDIIGNSDLVDWATRTMQAKAGSVLLNAGELIQINPGEPAQYIHRDSDSWPVPLDGAPFIVNAIIALDDFTAANGATHVAPGSWRLPPQEKPAAEDFQQAVMHSGDALLFRGDLLHGGGANNTRAPRRALSISYCAGWLRPVENSFLNIPRARAQSLPPHVQGLLGYAAHDGSRWNAGLVGLYENGDPARYLLSAEQT